MGVSVQYVAIENFASYMVPMTHCTPLVSESIYLGHHPLPILFTSLPKWSRLPKVKNNFWNSTRETYRLGMMAKLAFSCCKNIKATLSNPAEHPLAQCFQNEKFTFNYIISCFPHGISVTSLHKIRRPIILISLISHWLGFTSLSITLLIALVHV